MSDPKLLKDYPRWDSETFVDVLARAASWDLGPSLVASAKASTQLQPNLFQSRVSQLTSPLRLRLGYTDSWRQKHFLYLI